MEFEKFFTLEFLTRVFQLLGDEDICQSRLVCKLWNTVGNTISLKRKYITLTSSDGAKFLVHRSVTQISTLIRNASPTEEEMTFNEIRGEVLEHCVRYFYYKSRYSNCTTGIPEFEIHADIALDLLVAANFLNC